ncbi:MAG: Rieske 2Fe-2S domain-containing protein [Cyanobacteria bacterium P01_A01_bin.84]
MTTEIQTQIPAQMYKGTPWCLGRYESFEVNKPRKFTLLNHDYVIWKDKNGNLNALDNICPHAGANLAKGGRVLEFEGQSCLACPYHGNKVQFLGDGKVIVEGNISSKDIQSVLPLQVVNGLVWTYGLDWEKENGRLFSQAIEPKLPIPDYSNIAFLPDYCTQLDISKLNHIYSFSESFNGNILQLTWNVHDGEHFAGTHYDSMLTKELTIENLTQNENKISWQLFLYKRDDKDANKNKMSPFVNDVMVQCFNTFLPNLFILTNEIAKGKLFVTVGYGYPESPTKTRLCVEGYFNFEYTWWHKLLKFPQKGNQFRDTLLSEDLSILNNLYPTFHKKIALKNDTPAQLAINYLQNWNF